MEAFTLKLTLNPASGTKLPSPMTAKRPIEPDMDSPVDPLNRLSRFSVAVNVPLTSRNSSSAAAVGLNTMLLAEAEMYSLSWKDRLPALRMIPSGMLLVKLREVTMLVPWA